MSDVTVTVCRSCPAGREGLADGLRSATEDAGLACVIAEVECMSGCARSSTVAFRAEHKTAYLFGDISTADIPYLLVFLRLYRDAPDGNFADARPLGPLREKALARIPG